MNYFHHHHPFHLEAGGMLPELTVAYHTYGTLNETRDNVVWICHALTANSAAAEWWPGVVGEGAGLDPDKYFIVCANILGSCYGTTGPLSINPQTGKPWYGQFPQITIRDMVRCHQLVCNHLNIRRIHLLVGGSMGGYQAIEWCLSEPQKIERLFMIASSAKETAWGIAIHTAQRLAIEADASWRQPKADAGVKGLKAARAIAMLTYRSYDTYRHTQEDPDPEKLDGFRASGYMEHQGNKLVQRFNAYSYYTLSKAMDSHNISRGRKSSVTDVLRTIGQDTLVIGIANDLLCPLEEINLLATNIPKARKETISSLYGHDGFLTEHRLISAHLRDWLPYNK